MNERVPPRAYHLLPLPILAAQLAPAYAKGTNRLVDEVVEELESGLRESHLHNPMVEYTWRALMKARPTLDEAALLEKVARAMAKSNTGPRPMEPAERTLEKMTPLLALIDVNAGRASDTARAMLETPEGKKMMDRALQEAAAFLADRLLSASKTKTSP